MATQARIRLITYSPELLNGEPIYVSSNCQPVMALNFEPAGLSFHSAALRLRGVSKKESVDDDSEKVSKDKEHDYMQSSDSYGSKGKKKSKDGKKQQDHYALLGLGHLRFMATEEQIRKSYRETALKYHPDKQASSLLRVVNEAAKQAKKEEIENRFKAIHDAYEALMDPVRRRIYDSTDEFDDEIPTECAPQNFFKVFGPAFMRNGRWSVSQPVPSLGDDTTPLKKVDEFYDFWYSFKSWREFPSEDDFDLEQADSREHKRWMERQNYKNSEKARKEEYARVRNLVQNAYKRDPRVLRRKEEEKAEKKMKKQAKYRAQKIEEEKAARIAEEERQRKEEEEKMAAAAALNQKKAKEKEKKLLRKERTRVRTLSAPFLSQNLLDLSEDDVECICMSLDIDNLRNLCNNMEGKEVLGQAQLIKDALDGNKNHECDDGEKRDIKNVPHQNGFTKVNGTVPLSSMTTKKDKPWGKEEIELLRKGIQKYPKGTSRRWEVVSEYIGTGRTVEEILKATKTVLLQKPDNDKAYDSFLEKRKPTVSISSPLTTREEVEGVPSNNTSSSQTESHQNNTEVVPVANGNGGVSLKSDQDIWSTVQESALVQALKTFPKEATQRWERVAAAVPGKTVNQCKKKFNSLKENFRSKMTAV